MRSTSEGSGTLGAHFSDCRAQQGSLELRRSFGRERRDFVLLSSASLEHDLALTLFDASRRCVGVLFTVL